MGKAALPRRLRFRGEEKRPPVGCRQMCEKGEGEAGRRAGIPGCRGADLMKGPPMEAAAQDPVEPLQAERDRRGRRPVGNPCPSLPLRHEAAQKGEPVPRHESAVAHGLDP